MGSAKDRQYKALLPAGAHHKTLAELKSLCVDPFPESTRRPTIYTNFLQIFHLLSSAGFDSQLWINGSYLSEKPEPDDIDFVCFASHEVANNGQPHQKLLVEEITKQIYAGNHCHTFFAPVYPVGHPLRKIVTEKARDYWSKRWGADYHNNPKGFVVLTIGSPLT